MYYILFYKTVHDYIEKRTPYRDEHLKLLKIAHNEGSLVMAGALANPADGGVFIFKSEDTAKSFANNDPYVSNGLILSWEVRPWSVVIGG